MDGFESFVTSGEARYKLIGFTPWTEQLVRKYTATAHRLSPDRYTDADPLKLLWVDPDCIQYEISGRASHLRRFGRVYSGDWDQNLELISDNTIYKSFEERFNGGASWDETEYYQKMSDRIHRGQSTRAGSSQSELDQYFSEMDELYRRIGQDGYRSQSSLEATNPEETRLKNMDAPVPAMNEVGVCIGREGALIHRYRGAHRLAIAKVADIDAVPIQVLSRHSAWQRVRDEYRAARSIDGVRDECLLYSDHPDLQDCVPKDTAGLSG
ncbi:hypothetical protein [Natronobacterium gregoryi]|uniref:hypothetical protein n=1 Tax=Natronobacterium gregoryi TaxID=44930 RepID=UPI00111355C9|nr:hypothetical protein [Natronobacterium gregoryi]